MIGPVPLRAILAVLLAAIGVVGLMVWLADWRPERLASPPGPGAPTPYATDGTPTPRTAVVAPTSPPPTGFLELTSRLYPRQRYHLYVPRSYERGGEFRLLVVMHGTERRAEDYAEEFTGFADDHRYVILAPVVPRGERFQQLGIGDDSSIRTDLRLLELVEEVGARYRIDTASFDLFGFSAGAQFAHRFMYVHPERLRSVVAAAPGTVTLPTERYRWPHGLAGLERLATTNLDLEKVRKVRTMLIVGEDDVGDSNLNDSDDANRFGRTRLKRARTLHVAWQEASIQHEYVEVPDVGHELHERLVRRVTRFLADG